VFQHERQGSEFSDPNRRWNEWPKNRMGGFFDDAHAIEVLFTNGYPVYFVGF
jgi:hypothetical protein